PRSRPARDHRDRGPSRTDRHRHEPGGRTGCRDVRVAARARGLRHGRGRRRDGGTPGRRGRPLHLRHRDLRRRRIRGLKGDGPMATVLAAPDAAATRVRPLWTLVHASAGAFLTALDIVVVAMALPALRGRLHASLAQLDWTINGYTLAFACLMLTGAAIGDRFGRRRTYVAGILVFTLGSALAAMSTSAGALIGARLVQGVGAAVLTPLTLTLIVDAYPAPQ